MSTARFRYAPLPLRLILGISFLYHGWPKLFSAEGHAGFVGMLQGLSIPAPGFMSWVVGVVEVGGGLALLVGAFVPLVVVPLIVEMVVALAKVHFAAGFSFIHVTGMGPGGMQFGMPGYEVNLLFLAALVSLGLSGAGPLSIDGAREIGRSG